MKPLDMDFLRRVLVTSSVLAIVLFLFGSVYFGWRSGLGLAFGTAWSVANLYLMIQLVKVVVQEGQIRRKRVVLLALVKFPVLYGLAYLILRFGELPVMAFVIGFGIPFAVMVLKVLGRMLNEHLSNKPPQQLRRAGTEL